jgi:hypothetical protein
MIRVTIELIPTGIKELARPVEKIEVACKYPLNSARQELMIFSETDKGYAEISGYDLESTIYNPPDGKPKWIELAYTAIGELLNQRTTRAGGEFLAGMFALDPEQFDEKIAALVDGGKKDIQAIYLFGKRSKEVIDQSSFMSDLIAHAQRINNLLPAPQQENTPGAMLARVDGDYLRKIYPNFIPYDLAIKLDPQLYKPHKKAFGGQTFNNSGEVVEAVLVGRYCKGDNPNIPGTTCFNGLLFHFMRPDGSISIPMAGMVVTKRKEAHFTLGEFEYHYTYDGLKAEIQAARVIYNKKTGLQKYPGLSPSV